MADASTVKAKLQAARDEAVLVSVDATVVTKLDSAIAECAALMPAKRPIELRQIPLGSRAMMANAINTHTAQYDRFTHALCFRAVPFTVNMAWWGPTTGNATYALHADTDYTMSLFAWDDVDLVTNQPKPGAVPVTTSTAHVGDVQAAQRNGVNFVFTVLPPSACYLGFITDPVDEYCLPAPILILRPGEKQDYVFFYEGVFQWVHDSITVWNIARIPIERCNGPKLYPRKQRPNTPFPFVAKPAQLNQHFIVPSRNNTIHAPAVMNNGCITGANRHNYFINDFRKIGYPGALVDGPRGHARSSGGLSLAVGHNGGSYEWSGGGTAFAHYLPDDTRVTLMGHVHEVPIYYADIADNNYKTWSPYVKSIGDWDPAAPGPHLFVNVWAWCWDKRTIRQGAPNNPQIDGQVTHDGDVYMYWMDRGDDVTKGRFGLAIFDGADPNRGKIERYDVVMPDGRVVDGYRSLAKPPRIYVLQTGLDPDSLGGMVHDTRRGFVYLTQRKQDKIIKIKPPTVAPRGQPFVNDSVLAGDLIASTKPARTYGSFADDKNKWYEDQLIHMTPYSTFTLAQRQAETIIAPEDLDYVDDTGEGGDDYVTWSGRAQAAVKRMNLVTGAIDLLWSDVNWAVGKTYFIKHEIAQGTAFPRWSIFVQDFAQSDSGPIPIVLIKQADGSYKRTPWFINVYNNVGGNGAQGWEIGTYSCDIAGGQADFSMGKIIASDTQEGLWEITLAQPGEVPPNLTKLSAGARKWKFSGHRMTGGYGGYATIDVDDPTDPDELYYVQCCRAA